MKVKRGRKLVNTINSGVFSCLRFLFDYRKILLPTALLFAFLLPALALLNLPEETVRNSPSPLTLKEMPKQETPGTPFTLKESRAQIEIPIPLCDHQTNEEEKSQSASVKTSPEENNPTTHTTQNEVSESLEETGAVQPSEENENEKSQKSSNFLFEWKQNEKSKTDSTGEEEKETTSSVSSPPTPSNLTVLSGNLKDILAWEGESGLTYRIYRSSSPTGPFTLIAETEMKSFTVEEDRIGYRYYRVSSVKDGLESDPTTPEVNDKVYIRETLSPDKDKLIISSNGELRLAFPVNAVSEEITITIEENGIPHDTPNYTDTFLTSSYDFQPEGLTFLAKPFLSLAYLPPLREENFEKDWLAKTAKLYYYDKDIKVWLDVSDNLVVDVEKNYITSQVSHFSDYAGGYTVMPHGRYSDNTSLCEVCHDTHDSKGNSLVRRENIDLCYYCHGAPTSTLPPAETHSSNVRAEFIDASDQIFQGNPTTQTVTTVTQSFHQNTQSEFNQNTLYHTEATSTEDGEIILSTFNKNPFSDDFNDGVVDPKWTGIDINASPAGSESESGGTLTVQAGGGRNGLKDGPGSRDDDLRFTYQSTVTPTKFDVRVKIESLGNATGRDFAGLMIRDGTSDNAKYFAVGVRRERERSLVTALYRTEAGNNAERRDGSIDTLPVWVRIVKEGNFYSAYESNDGTSWNLITSQNITVSDFKFGLATTAGDRERLTTAVYDDFSVPTYDSYEYYTTGTVTSVEIAPSRNLYEWGTLSWSESLNGGDITIDVLGYNGSSWDVLKTGLTNPSGENLSDIDASTYGKLKLVAHLIRGGPSATPYLNWWDVSYVTFYVESPSNSRHPVPERKIVCADCHTPHRDPDKYPKLLFEWQPNGGRKYYKDEKLNQSEKKANRWSRRYVASSSIGNRFCWGCHGEWNNTRIDSSYYSNTRGDHKSNFLLSPHNSITWTPPASYDPTCGITNTTSTGINCLACHLKHGSSSSSNLIGYKGTDSPTYRGNGLCYACHEVGKDAPPRGYFKGESEYKLSAHGSNPNVLWPGGEYGSSYPAQSAGKENQCVNCHNPHGEMDDDSKGALYPKLCVEQTFTTSSPSDGGDLCFTCHDSNGPASDKKTEFSYAGSHHPVEKGNPTCNNCHNPHLSDPNTIPHRVIIDPDDAATLYPLSDVPNPDDTSTPYPDSEVFCMDCHDGSWPGAPDISYELNNRTYDPSRTVSNFWYHHDHQPDKGCRGCHRGGGDAPFKLIFNGHYTHAKIGGTGNTTQNASCTYCHDPHGTPGTDSGGAAQRGKMLKSWIRVNAYPYEGTSQWNGRKSGSPPISCSLNDPAGACHNVTYTHSNRRDASKSGCSQTDCHSNF